MNEIVNSADREYVLDVRRNQARTFIGSLACEMRRQGRIVAAVHAAGPWLPVIVGERGRNECRWRGTQARRGWMVVNMNDRTSDIV